MKKYLFALIFCLAKAFAVPLSVSQQIDTFAVAHGITPATLPAFHHVCTGAAGVFTTAFCGDTGGSTDSIFIIQTASDTAHAVVSNGRNAASFTTGAFSGALTVSASGSRINPGNVSTLGALASSALNMDNFSGLNNISQLGAGYTGNGALTWTSAYISFQEKSALGSGKGDWVFGTRNTTADAQPSERMRITAAGNVNFSGPGNVTTLGQFSTSAINLDNFSGLNNISQLTAGYMAGGANTWGTGFITLVETDGNGQGKGDWVFGTRNVTTDAAPDIRVRIKADGSVVDSGAHITYGKFTDLDTSVFTLGARLPFAAHSAGQDSMLAVTTAGRVHTMPTPASGTTKGYVDSAFEDGRNASFTDLSASTVTANDFYSATLSNVDAVAAWYADVGSKPRLGSILKSPGDTLATTAEVFLLGKMHWDSTWQAFTDYHLGDAVAAPTGSDPTVEGYTFVCGQFTCAGASGLDAAVGFSKLGVTGEDTSVTVTLSGCTVSTTGTASISRSGHNINLTIPAMSCTSNSSTAIISGIPAKYWPALVSTSGLLNVTNNSVSGLGYAEFETNGDIVLSNTLVSLITGGISTPSSSFTNGQDKGVQSFSMSAVR